MALPKRRVSSARRDRRRSHMAATPPPLEECPQCHSPKVPHRVCRTCGTYAGREIIQVKGPKARPE